MADIQIRPAQPEDIGLLLENIRQADLDELTASHGEYADLEAILINGLERSGEHAWTMFIDGQLALIGGVAPGGSLIGGSVGIPWMLGTNVIRAGTLTRAAMRYFAQVKEIYPELSNYVDARNVKAIRWIRRMGFTVEEKPTLAGPNRMPFYRFWVK